MDYSIFRAYDIRGLYPEQINREAVYNIGRAFALFIKDFYNTKNPTIAVGYDIRKSSKEIFEGLADGLIEEGCEVLDIGLATTPLNYFANWHLNTEASAMITASHNPGAYNGIKFSLKQVTAIAEVAGLQKVKELTQNLPKETPKNKGSLKRVNVDDEYIEFLKKQAEGIDFSGLKIAVDCGNGMVGPWFEKLAKEIGLFYEGLYMDPDGDFPNHEPNPLDGAALKGIQELMKQESFELGVLFDGDGDRFMVLDKNGQLIKSDYLIAFFAKHFLPQADNKKIPCDARISRGAREVIRQYGGEIIKCKVGYPNLRVAMRKENAFFGGELSGHYFWQDFSCSESALLALVRLLKILQKENRSIEEIIEPMKTYFNTGEINFEVEDKQGKMAKAEEIFSDGKISKIDGITVEYPDWWFNMRASGTEPLLRLLVEAKTEELLDEKTNILREIITK